MKKENTGQQKQIYSIRKNKAYGASSVLIGLMGSAFLLSGLAPAVQAEENDVKPETKPADGSAVNGTNAPTVETEHLIIASQPKESEPKSESTPTDNPKSDVENAPTNETKPLNSESTQPKEESAAPVNPKEEAKPTEEGTTEAKPTEERTASKRAVSIVYKVRYVDRKSGKVVHEVTKTKTVETTEAKAKVTVTEIGGELANDSQLENYYVPDGNPTTFTKEIVEGEDNVFVYEVEGFGEAETPKERTVALKYMVEYVDGKSGLVLASEEKEEKVSTTETVAKKEVTVYPSLSTNEKLKDWVLSEGSPASQPLSLSEGTVGKVTFKLQSSEGGKVRNKRKVQTPIVDGKPYLTMENYTPGWENRESMTFLGNGQNTYNIVYKTGASSLPNNNIETDVELTQGAKDLGFTWDRANGLLSATLTPTSTMKGNYEVGFYVKSNPNIKVSGTITITAKEHYGFMIMNDQNDDYFPYFRNESNTTTDTDTNDGNYSSTGGFYKGNSPFYRINSMYFNTYLSDYVENNHPKAEVTINGLRMPSTPFGYFMPDARKRVSDANQDTKRYYTMLPIFAPMNRSKDFANNDKQGLAITKFTVLEASNGVEAKLIDLRHDKAPDKGFYRNDKDFQTVTSYNEAGSSVESHDYTNTPYYLQFTKLPKVAGNYYATVEITDSLGLTKKIRLNFTTYENSISGNREFGGESYALTTADTLFEVKKEYVDEKNGTVTIPTSNKEQILGKVVLNKENAYIQPNEFPPGIELRPTGENVAGNDHLIEANVVKRENVKITPGSYSFKVTARDGHFQEGGVRSFNFDVVDAINPIADQRWRESSVPTPIPVSMENGSKITGIRVETSGGYAVFEGNPNDSNISIYGLKRTTEKQNARVYVTFTDGDGKTHTTFTDFKYEIEPNTVDDLEVTVTNSTQEISEGGTWQDMVITTTPSEGVTIKVDKTKLPKGTRVVGNVIKGKGLYEGVYEIPILAIKGDIVKSTAVHLTVKPGEFVVPPETSEVEVLSNDIKAITTDEDGTEVKTPVLRYGLQNIPKGAKVTYSGGGYNFQKSGMKISADKTEIIGTPSSVGEYILNASVSWRASNGVTRTATTTYNINVTGILPTLTISSPTQPTDAYTSEENRLIASIGSPIPMITIKHNSHSLFDVGTYNLPKGLTYSYDDTTHTATITGTPTEINWTGYVHRISVSSRMPDNYAALGYYRNNAIEKEIYIEVTPVTSNLTIDNADQTFAADKQMTPITVSDFDNRATIRVEGAPDGVSYNTETHQITGAPTAGVGHYRFYVTATMPRELDAQVTRKQIDLTVTKLEPTLTANPPSVEITAKENIPTIMISKDSFSTLSEPTVRIDGTSGNQPLSSLGLRYSYDAETHTATITGTPTVVGSHTILLSTTLSQRYSGTYGGVTKELSIPLTVNRKEFDFIEDQKRETTVLSPITPVELNVPEGIDVELDERQLPRGVTYDREHKVIKGTPERVGEYSVTVTAKPNGVTGNDKTATVTIKVNPLTAGITISNNGQNVQVGTQMNSATVTPNEHASVYGTDALLNAFSSAVNGGDSGIDESHIANYFLGAYGLTYNLTTHTITGTPTKTGRIVFTFIARNSADLGGKEAKETFVLNVVESLSKIPVITEAQEGSNAVKGSGVAGATVTVTLPDGAVKTAEVATDGTWTVETTTPLVKGQSISARQKEVNKTESNDISATVVGNSGLVPSKEALVDAIVEEATTITGKGENGSTITVTRPDGTVKTATVSEGTWSVTLDKAAVKGENILVTQTEANKATSPAVTATVVPKITKGDQGKPGETGPKGEQGEPGTPGAPGKDGFTPEISVTPNDDGSYTITITQPNGKEPIRTTVKNGTNGTNGRDGRTPKVKLTPIYEDPAHPRTRRIRSVDENREAQPTGKQIGVHITVYFDNNDNGTYDEGDELISEENIYDGVDGIDGRDGTNGTNGTNGRDGANGNDGTAGATGETGAAGRDGRDGKDILNGTENPGENQGKDGDTFVNTKTGDVFVKENGTWKPAGNIKGPKGDDGKDILNGKTNPTSETGKDGDKYVNTETGDIFVKENGTWKSAGNIKGPKGDKGENGTNGTDGRDGTNGTNGTDGVAGATGAAGHDGRDGKDILNGTENPGENQGKDGDTFVNTKTGDVFVKENGTWKPAGNIKGPKGDDGKDILNGKTNPTSETGKDGDKYVNTETGDIFVKENGTWKSAGNIKGPKGDKGENGTNGTDGRDGTNGTNGTDGVAGATGAAGHDGRDGKDILNGTENPGENQGKDGDTFVNTKTGDVFVKENGTWKPAGNIKGPKGDDGKDILNGKTNPTSETGKDGDKYVNTETGDIFVKENGTWKSAGNIKGPKGDKGENGTNGTDGRDGTNGTNGTDGVAGATGAAGHDGRDGKDGQSPTVTVRENTDGSHTIVITNPNGNTIETTVRDGKSPTVTVRENTDGTHTITIENADGKTTTTTVRDGKNGQSPTVSIRNNNDGTHTVTIINPDGSKTEAVIKDGKDGKDGQSPTVSVTNNGNGTHTIIITSSDGKVTTTVIKDGKCGCNDKPGGSTPGEPTRENSTTPSPGAPTPGGSTTPNPGVPTPGGSTTPNPGAPTPGGSTTPNPGAPTPGGSTTPNPGASTPGGSTTPNPGAPTPGGSTTPNPGAPTPGGSTRPNPNSDEDPEMPEPPVHELPEYPLEIPNTLENSTNPNPGGSTTPNPGAPTPGGTPDRNPGGEPGTNPGALTPGTTPNQPVNPPEVSITVNEHPYGELPKTGTATDHLSILLGSGILLTLYVSRKKEEQS